MSASRKDTSTNPYHNITIDDFITMKAICSSRRAVMRRENLNYPLSWSTYIDKFEEEHGWRPMEAFMEEFDMVLQAVQTDVRNGLQESHKKEGSLFDHDRFMDLRRARAD